MLEKIKEIGEKIKVTVQAILILAMSFAVMALIGTIAFGFITLCLGAL
jgi:hypothetical protein